MKVAGCVGVRIGATAEVFECLPWAFRCFQLEQRVGGSPVDHILFIGLQYSEYYALSVMSHGESSGS
jgi:hypothetical protein